MTGSEDARRVLQAATEERDKFEPGSDNWNEIDKLVRAAAAAVKRVEKTN